MKVSLNWLKQYVEVSESKEEISDILTNTGLEVEGMESYESIKGSLAGLVIGEVLSCQKHPGADKLSVTMVDVKGENPLQIVCGAPNVAAGQKVVVATVGAVLYPENGEPFKIKKGKIRGEESWGMICAEDEIGLGKSHDGIMVLNDNAHAGQAALEYFAGQVVSDVVYEIGLTPNRSDATGHLGTAFDLAAALKTNYENQGVFKKPDVSGFAVQNNNLEINVSIENPKACPRYSGVCIQGVTIQDSPEWMQQHLKAIGVEPKNNIVDITNYVLHESGQPLHAFDYDQIAGKKVIVKNLADKTKFTTLDEAERELSSEDLMICNGNNEGMCIAGVFGGVKSGVSDNTTNIFLESAFFNAISVRRSSMRHLLRTDAATRFEKGTDPNGTLYALKRAALLIQEFGGGTIASDIVDIYPQPVEKAKVLLKYSKVTDLIGADIPKEDIRKILGYLDMNLLEENEDSITVDIPTNKVDVTRDADVIEEILRIYGYNKVETPETVNSVLSFAASPNPFKVRNLIADLLTSSGFNEMMSTSMTKSGYYQKHLPQDENTLVFVNNTSNQHLDLMRPSMLFSGLETIVHNQNRQQGDLKLYEFGKTYFKKVVDGEGNMDYFEEQHLSLFLTGQRNPENWLNYKGPKVCFYSLKAFVEHVMTRLGVLPSSVQCTAVDNDVFTYGLKYHRGKQNIVSFGRLNGNIALGMGVKQEVFYADFDFDTILKVLKKHKMKYQAMSKYPAVRRDLALVLDKNTEYNQILGIAVKTGGKQLRATNLFDVYENDEHVGKGKKSCSVSFIFQDDNKTLKDKDIDKVMSKLIATYENKLSALIRK
jgi:phenylalanyl-tRNA synthetase beta chain